MNAKIYLPVLFALLTGLFWGGYGPTLGQARTFLKSPFTPYLAIGVAYLVWGIGGGAIGMFFKGDSFTQINSTGLQWAFAAGSLGAFGALALTLAMYSGGTAMPQIVMPIVFGFAVTVSAVLSAMQQREYSSGLVIGIVIVAIGIVMVAYYTPHPHPPQKSAASTSA